MSELEIKIKSMQGEFQDFFAKSGGKSVMEAYIGWSTQKIARTELILEGLMLRINSSEMLKKELGLGS